MKQPPANCKHCGHLIPQSKSSVRNHMLKVHPELLRRTRGPEPKPRVPVDRTENYRTDRILRRWRRILRVCKKAIDIETSWYMRGVRQHANNKLRGG